jgi:hypothetical protein
MPYIGTSSDQYQNHDPALTTYRKNTAAPTLREAMAERSEDKSKAAALARRTVEGRSSPERPMAVAAKASENDAVAVQTKEPVTPQLSLQPVYSAPSRLLREHDDRFSMITGGTVDVKA